MKFLINRSSYKRLGEATEYGTIPFQTTSEGRNFFLKTDAASILNFADTWTDFSDLAKDFDQTKIQDYKDALTLLLAFGIAQIKELPEETQKNDGIFVAGEREYAAVSEFLSKNVKNKCNFSLDRKADISYFSPSKVRERQFNNIDYHFMYKKSGKISALLIVRCLPPETLSSSLLLCGLLFDVKTGESERQSMAHELIARISKEFGMDYKRLRFLRKLSDPQFDGIETEETLRILITEDFIKTARLERELQDGGDVEIYDLDLKGDDSVGFA